MAPVSKTPLQVIEMLAPHVLGRYPCASAVIAQLILEVGFALRTPKDMVTGRESYNLGNIKGKGPAGSVTILTTEYYTPAQVESARKAGKLVKVLGAVNGKQKVQIKDEFRAYHSYAEAIEDHFSLLKKPRYVRAGVWQANTPRAFAEALHRAGYATDPRYVDKIMAIVNQYGLTRFDSKSPEPSKQTTQPSAVEKLAQQAQKAVIQLIFQEWQLQLADKAIDNLAAKHDFEGKALIQNAAEWKQKLRKEPEKVLNDLPWLIFVLIDRATNTPDFVPQAQAAQHPEQLV